MKSQRGLVAALLERSASKRISELIDPYLLLGGLPPGDPRAYVKVLFLCQFLVLFQLLLIVALHRLVLGHALEHHLLVAGAVAVRVEAILEGLIEDDLSHPQPMLLLIEDLLLVVDFGGLDRLRVPEVSCRKDISRGRIRALEFQVLHSVRIHEIFVLDCR